MMVSETTPTLQEEYRDSLASEAPINYDMVCAAYGCAEPDLTDGVTRAAFFAVWARLNYEYADAMIAEGRSG